MKCELPEPPVEMSVSHACPPRDARHMRHRVPSMGAKGNSGNAARSMEKLRTLQREVRSATRGAQVSSPRIANTLGELS
jgi:hypothetical protein